MLHACFVERHCACSVREGPLARSSSVFSTSTPTPGALSSPNVSVKSEGKSKSEVGGGGGALSSSESQSDLSSLSAFELGVAGYQSELGCWHRWDQIKLLKSKQITVAPYALMW